jgi:hypothetical protein
MSDNRQAIHIFYWSLFFTSRLPKYEFTFHFIDIFSIFWSQNDICHYINHCWIPLSTRKWYSYISPFFRVKKENSLVFPRKKKSVFELIHVLLPRQTILDLILSSKALVRPSDSRILIKKTRHLNEYIKDELVLYKVMLSNVLISYNTR